MISYDKEHRNLLSAPCDGSEIKYVVMGWTRDLDME
jgi:hypothetical protein